ncbi:MAG: DMT family transporter [Proteobacteria bacterium]|nr:DMT family transporter [Pseudomonadota bacterium]
MSQLDRGAAFAAPADRRIAILAMLAAVTIYGTNFAISRHAIVNGLTPLDLTALRFATAGLVLAPLFWRAGIADCAGIGWGKGLVLTLMSGVPMTFLMMLGLSMAPAAHGASIGPGTVTTIGVIGGIVLFGIKPSRFVIAGIATVLAGLACIAIAAGISGSPTMLLGDLCFLGVGLLWGGYPLMLQVWKVDALKATTVLSVISALVFLPFYILAGYGATIAAAPLWLVVFHAFNQGILNMIIGLWLWGFAVGRIGATVTGRFPPLIPVIGTLSAIPLLGEWPVPLQWAGVALIVGGLMLTTRK